MENNYNIEKGNKVLKTFSVFDDKETKLEKARHYAI